MIPKTEILKLAREASVPPSTVEKDYVLGWFLAGIAMSDFFRTTWVFKGGTCLKKCYFGRYRFSEDLDFTVPGPKACDPIVVAEEFVRVANWIEENSGIEIPRERIRFEAYTSPVGWQSTQGRVYYRGPLKPRANFPRVKFDLTSGELLAKPPVSRPLIHDYSDELAGVASVLCYDYEEVFAEKFRALLERARPRDVYDVVNLFEQERFPLPLSRVRPLLERKLAHKQVALPSYETVAAYESIRALRSEWERMLGHQVASLATTDDFLMRLKRVFAWLDGASTG